MKVKELIEELNRIENKEAVVAVYEGQFYEPIKSISEGLILYDGLAKEKRGYDKEYDDYLETGTKPADCITINWL